MTLETDRAPFVYLFCFSTPFFNFFWGDHMAHHMINPEKCGIQLVFFITKLKMHTFLKNNVLFL